MNGLKMDWLETEPLVDAGRVAVVGHSRGGKTALWTGVTDTRFAMACVSGSGCLTGRCSWTPQIETAGSIAYAKEKGVGVILWAA